MLRSPFRKITTLLSVYYAYMVEYRAELFFWVLSGSLPMILLGVWTEAANSVELQLSALDFARYFIAVFAIRQFTLVWVIWDFEKEVSEGKLSFALLQPIDPAWRHLAGHMSERLARLPFIAVLVFVFFVVYPDVRWVPSFGQVLLCLFTTAIAFGMRFLMQYTFAMAAFWVEKASAIEQTWFLFYIFLSGYIAPLETFPPLMREIALLTPFPYVIYFPAAIIMGLPVRLWEGLVVMAVWSLIFFVLNRYFWRKGLKHYAGMGA
ncbi:ABC transporter permease [[Limnothrix rosea] IAM M-220]|uniref:ABC transporter permease n=1 Tax=[Limnothrix rosea] IAM M-220 TaxID=454133 RepID=UPI0009626FC6|nr:ABC-2 family transporter protein [[Limnothrix rosea] IAM M-220]OKH18177.1 multidrug ABC transporter permease [[Limnothrix rosea] IAM M-220]